MSTRKMKVSDWIKVMDNPIQRDTEKHAAKAKHLLTPLSIHAIVCAAQLPDGRLVKLDGHTRALLWKRNQVRHPPELEVNIIDVADMEEAKRLYQTLDSKEALETVTDKVSGAFGEHNFHPESALLKRGSIASALRMCWSIHRSGSIAGGDRAVRSSFSIYEAVEEFSNEIFALDAYDLKSSSTSSGIVAAFILTHRKHGAKILPFWTAVFANGGTKCDGKMDAVQALNELVLSRRGKFGGVVTADTTARAVMAAEKWLRDEEFTRVPHPYDLTNYIKDLRPQVQLIKKAAA